MTRAVDRGAGYGWRDWRPMPFGSRPAGAIRNPVIEPLWRGRRVLVHLASGESEAPTIEVIDEDGIALAGHPDLRAALTAAARAGQLVIDGYLAELPRRNATGIFGGGGAVLVPGLSQTARQLVTGRRGATSAASGSSGRRRDAAQRSAPDGGDPLADVPLIAGFVAVDLLAIDREALLDVPLLERKRLLNSALAAGELVRLGPHVRPPGEHWYGQWRAFGFREIAVKSANSRYQPGRPSDDWSITPLPRG